MVLVTRLPTTFCLLSVPEFHERMSNTCFSFYSEMLPPKTGSGGVGSLPRIVVVSVFSSEVSQWIQPYDGFC